MMFSKTKIEILKKLNERNYTTSELSKILGKSKSTISEHLNALYKMGLVDKERHSKWVYYKITNKGKKALENLEALILIMGSVFALIGLWIYYIFKQIKYQAREVVLSKTVVERSIYTTYKGSTTFQKEPLFLIFLIISTFLIIFIVYLVYKIIRR
ncbi:MAG: helix-turn-helix transcriptional regulator [Methanococci archaeon]|nr:helix-turn-helix transcriptional regulator [Methanococci archaeon]